MSKNKAVIQHIIFWGIIAMAFTAEGWMNLICKAVF